jgi:hypothetical protein
MRIGTFLLLAVCFLGAFPLCSSAQGPDFTVFSTAHLAVQCHCEPTPQLSDFTTYKFTAISDLPIQGFDFYGDGYVNSPNGRGFFGFMNLNQVHPAGMDTAFQDVNAFFPFVNADVRQDSQFLFFSPNVVVIPSSTHDTNSLLQSAFASPTPFGTSVPFAQIAASGNVYARGLVGFAPSAGQPAISVEFSNSVPFGATCAVPETSTLVLGSIACLSLCLRRRSERTRLRKRLLRNKLVAVVLLMTVVNCGLVTESRGELIGTFGPAMIEASHVPTAGLAGFSTWTLSATSNLPMQGFDFGGSIDGQFGFFGPLNQAPPSQISPFLDLFALDFFAEFKPRDSHFKFFSSALTVVPGFTVDSTSALRAVFAAPAPFGTHVEIAQLVIADTAGSFVDFRGQVGFAQSTGQKAITVIGRIGTVPEPASAALAAFALAALFGFIRRR